MVPPVVVTDDEVTESPAKLLVDDSWFERLLAAVFRDEGLADAATIAEPEVIEVIVMTSTFVVFSPIMPSRAEMMLSISFKTVDTVVARVRLKTTLVLFKHFHPCLVKPLIQVVQ